jgi:hypothetical protein
MRTILIAATMLAVLQPGEAGAQFPGSGYPAWQEKFRDGACLITRRQDKTGTYKEEILCEGLSRDIAAPKLNEEYYLGDCKVTRRQQSNGEAYFARECRAPE